MTKLPSAVLEPGAVRHALERSKRLLRQSQRPDGSWDSAGHVGAWVTAQVLVVLAHLKALTPEDASEGARWLRTQQLPDGSFPLYPSSTQGNLDATTCAWAALHVTAAPENEGPCDRARAWMEAAGGLPAVVDGMASGNLGAVYAVLAGLMDASAVPCPPTGLVLLPGVLSFLRTRFHSGVLQGFFELSVLLRRLRGDWGADGAKRGLLGRLTCWQLVQLLGPFQNPDGSWNDSCVLTVLALPALAAAGSEEARKMSARGLSWLASQRVQDASGVRFDGFGTEVWSTAFDARALLAAGVLPTEPSLARALTWLVEAQVQTPMPKVDDRHRNAALVGGWAFQRSNPRMPDCDDTGVVLSTLGRALRALGGSSDGAALASRLRPCVERGKTWLEGMQNPDGGWSAFVWGLPGKAPGAMMDTTPRVNLRDPLAMLGVVLRPPPSMGDPSTEDVTSRVLHGLGQVGLDLSSTVVTRAVEFLRHQQCSNGAWWGRWVVNYLSSTAFVLMGLRAVGVDMSQEWVRRAVQWVLSRQNADGGWGEGPGSYRQPSLAGVGPSMPPLTGLVVQGLLDAGEQDHPSVAAAVAYLLRTQCPDGTWPNNDYLHTNIPPDTFYVYAEAARFYPTEALAKYSLARAGAAAGEAPSSLWTTPLLDQMRQTGDPVADAVVAEIFRAGRPGAINQLLAGIFRSDDPIPPGLPEAAQRFFETTAALPAWSETEKLVRAQDVFQRAGGFVAAGLFCSSLPQAYAAAKGAQVLTQTLGMTRHLRQRVFETAQFLFDVLDVNALGPEGRGIRAAQKIRLMHAAIRHLLLTRTGPKWNVELEGLPINQEDLAGTLMTFSAVTLDALERFGVPVTSDEAAAWIHLWSVIGHLMGIDPCLLPKNRMDADHLMEAVRNRQWNRSAQGCQLIQPLLAMMEGFLPGPELQGLPVVMIRHLAGDHCADLLGLPPASWSRSLGFASRLLEAMEGAVGQSPQERLLAHATERMMEGIVLLEREGKQAQFRLPSSLHRTVNSRY